MDGLIDGGVEEKKNTAMMSHPTEHLRVMTGLKGAAGEIIQEDKLTPNLAEM